MYSLQLLEGSSPKAWRPISPAPRSLPVLPEQQTVVQNGSPQSLGYLAWEPEKGGRPRVLICLLSETQRAMQGASGHSQVDV